MDTAILSASEKETLTSRGYQLLNKIGEGAYAQVCKRSEFMTR